MKTLLVFTIVLCASLLPGGVTTSAGLPSKSPAVPSQDDLLAWKKIEDARDAAKTDPQKKAVLFSKGEMEGWARAGNFFRRGKGNVSAERWDSNYFDYPQASMGYPVVAAEQFANDPQPEPVKTHLESGFHLRESYTDVLAIEDPSQAIDKDRTADDLKGALITYTRDRKGQTDTWAAQASLLFSYVKTLADSEEVFGLRTLSYGLVPSISLHRVDTNKKTVPGEKSYEVDELTYRLGVFGKYRTHRDKLELLTLRGWAAYATDTGHESGIPAAQFEMEPQMTLSNALAIGYRKPLIRGSWRDHIEGVSDYFAQDNTVVGYQIRLRLHADLGDVINVGKTGMPEESFLRAGFITELRLAPVITDRLALTVGYSYLPAIYGPDDHNALFSASAEFFLIKNEENNQTLSLKATYEKGGVDITKQKVDSIQIGVAGTF